MDRRLRRPRARRARLPRPRVAIRPRRLIGRVRRGEGDASRWLATFAAAYAHKLGTLVFPGSLNPGLDATFDWFAADVARRTVHFARERSDPWVVGVIAARNLRAAFGLRDGMPVTVELLERAHDGDDHRDAAHSLPPTTHDQDENG